MFKDKIIVLVERRGFSIGKIAQPNQLGHGDVIELYDAKTEEPIRHKTGASYICTSNPKKAPSGEWHIDYVPVLEANDVFNELGDGGTFTVAQDTRGNFQPGDKLSQGNVWDQVPMYNRKNA